MTLLPVSIVGVGSYLPETILTNEDIVQRCPATSVEWIQEKTGIRTRRLANCDSSVLAVKAAQKALQSANIPSTALDLIISLSTSPDYLSPANACVIQKELGSTAAAFDMNSVCSSGIVGLITAAKFIADGTYKTVLITCSESTLRQERWTDRTTCVFFGDGAGAIIVQASSAPGIIASVLQSDGKGFEALQTRVEDQILHMDGRKVFEFAIHAFPDAVKNVVQKAGKNISDIDWIISHQANSNIIKESMRRLHMEQSKTHTTIEKYGNTISASIFITLDDAMKQNKIQKGDTVVLVGFGGGLTWGAVMIEW